MRTLLINVLSAPYIKLVSWLSYNILSRTYSFVKWTALKPNESINCMCYLIFLHYVFPTDEFWWFADREKIEEIASNIGQIDLNSNEKTEIISNGNGEKKELGEVPNENDKPKEEEEKPVRKYSYSNGKLVFFFFGNNSLLVEFIISNCGTHYYSKVMILILW